MEIIFLLIAIVFTILFVYMIDRTIATHKEVIRMYKESELLVAMHSIIGLILIVVVFVTLAAMNNTFWHLPYLTR